MSLRILRVVAAACMMVMCAAIAAAAHAWNRPFPSLWVDAYGDYSVVSMPAWKADPRDLPILAPLVGVDEDRVGLLRRTEVPRWLEDEIRGAEQAGRSRVSLVFATGGAEHVVDAEIRHLGRSELAWYFGIYLLLACSFLSSGLLVMRLGARRPAAVSYGLLSISSFVFLATFFDYHTTRWLTPLFAASTVGNVLGLFAIAATFPQPLWSAPRMPSWLRAAFGAGVALMIGVTAAPLLKLDVRWARELITALTVVSLLSLTCSVAIRWWRARGQQARELSAVLIGFLVVPAALGIVFAVAMLVNVSFVHVILPFAGILVPVSIGFALVRHNVLGVPALLTRWTVRVPVAFFALTAGALTTIFTLELVEGRGAVGVCALIGLLVSAALYVPVWQLLHRWAFPTAQRFRPTLSSLSDEVKARRDPEALRTHLGRISASLVPDATVAVLSLDELRAHAARTALPDDLFATRGYVFDGDDPFTRALLVPLRSGGELLGALKLSAKRTGAPYTADEIAVLEVVAGLGSLAVHNARVMREEEARHALEATVGRDDRRLAVDILAAEIAHEVAYPLNYFRHLLRQLGGGAAPKPDDIEIGVEEVQRLERMLASLRKLQISTPVLSTVPVRTIVERGVVLLDASSASASADAATAAGAPVRTVEIDIAPELRVEADPDSLLQVFANLLRNARQWAGPQGRVGVRARVDGRTVDLEVWDDGPGFPPEAAQRIFSPWYSGRPDGTGLGLAVTHRLVRAFGWTITAERAANETVFRIRAPLSGSVGEKAA